MLKGTRVHCRVRDAEFFIDTGIAHHLKRRVRTHGKLKIITTTAYVPNATDNHLPVRFDIPISGLRSGTHTLTVNITVVRLVKTRHGPKRWSRPGHCRRALSSVDCGCAASLLSGLAVS